MKDSIELVITVNGVRYPFRRALPLVVKASSGRMSVSAGIEPITAGMIQEAVEQLLNMAVIVLDNNMPHPREVWWQLDQAIRRCRVCGCTDDDCSQCIAAQGYPCHWIEDDLCSRCASEMDKDPCAP